MPAEIFDISDPEALRHGLRQARKALGAKALIVIPTDTHYALAGDGLSGASRDALARVKGWQTLPTPQIALPGAGAFGAFAATDSPALTHLVSTLWPGPLTVVVDSNQTLRWNLGRQVTRVGLRVIDHPVVAELQDETGPLIVSAAHPAGELDWQRDDLLARWGDDVAVVLSDPERSWGFVTPSSTILEVTGTAGDQPRLRVLRDGLIGRDRLVDAAGDAVVWESV